MAKDKTLLIGAGLLVAGTVAYFVFKPEPIPPPIPPPGEVGAQINSFIITT